MSRKLQESSRLQA
jgi:hypothetical protein